MATATATYLTKRLLRNVPYRHSFVFRDANGNVQASVASITSTVALDTCNPTATTNAPAVQSDNKHYYVDLTSSETAGHRIEILVNGSSVNSHYADLEVEPCLDSGRVENTTGSASGLTLPTTAVATADYYNGATIEIVRGTGAGQVRTIVDYDSNRVVTVDRAWAVQPIKDTGTEDNWSAYIIHPRVSPPLTVIGTSLGTRADVRALNGDTNAAQMQEKIYEGGFITSSVTNDTTPTTTTFTGAVGLSTTADFYNNLFALMTSGTLQGIARKITDYSGARLFTTTAFPVAPSSGDTFVIIARVEQ